MNSDTAVVALEIAREAGAIKTCPYCHGHDVSADNPDAERAAYAMAKSELEGGNRAFGGMCLEDVKSLIKNIIRDADELCPLTSNPDRN